MGKVIIKLFIKERESEMPNEKNEVVSAKPLTKAQQYQVDLVNELDKSMEVMGTNFTEYGKTCVINAIGSLVMYCQNNQIKLEEINPIVLKTQLQNVGFTQLNMAGLPAEAYFDIRKTWVEVPDKATGEVKSRLVYNVAIKPQGAGNEKLVRKYGVGIAPNGLHPAWEVREGDEITLPQYDGTTIVPPTWKRNLASLDKKVILVLYIVTKTDGSEEYLIATRESIKPNIIAQIRQNAMYKFTKEVESANGRKYNKTDTVARDEFYAKLNKEAENLTVDQLLEKYADYVNPTYTSAGSREAMILRKMKNNALKNYPREYDNSYIANAVADMYEDKDETVMEKAKVLREDIDVVEKVEEEIKELPPVENAPQDFEVSDKQRDLDELAEKLDAPF